MARRVLYAYVDGSDLQDVAELLEARLSQFIGGSEWNWAKPLLINQKREDDPSLGPDDMPDWELGLNVDLPDGGPEPAGWFKDIERIVEFLEQLHTETGREFVIGIGDNDRGYSEDWCFVDGRKRDLTYLREVLGLTEG